MIGVIIPAHNEERLIGRCLRSVNEAARHPQLGNEPVRIFVALDRCLDRTGEIARALGATTIVVDGGVGAARAAAADAALAQDARWLAMTDADSTVPDDWLSAQLACGADAFCGVVEVSDWSEHCAATRKMFALRERRCDGHSHVHGANLGVSAAAYRAAGGFAPLLCHEDVALVEALVASGARIARRGAPSVATSARRTARAPLGFSHYLLLLEESLGAARPEPFEH